MTGHGRGLGRARLVLGAAVVLALGACGDSGRTASHRAAGSTLVISTAADADYLFPPLVATTLGHEVTDQVFDPLADLGDSLNTIGDRGHVPKLAESWTWAPDSLSITFRLNPRARWHDGQPVTAKDVAFTWRLYTDSALGAPAAPLLANIAGVSTPDAHTVVMRLRRWSPEAFHQAASVMLILPEHVYGRLDPHTIGTSPVIRQPVGSGRFRFGAWNAGSRIVLVADSGNFRGRPRLDRVIWSIAPDITSAGTRLLTGEADFLEAMRPATVKAAATASAVRVIAYAGFRYGYLLFNLRDPAAPARPHPLFRDRMLRRALTMAIDRRAIVQNVFDSLAAVSPGPMVRSQPTSDTLVQQIPYDPQGAMRLLDSLGWRDHDGDGVRDRAGRPLAFAIMVPVSSADRQRMAVLLQGQLGKVGVRATVQPVEIASLVRAEDARHFDTAIQLWNADPSPAGLAQNFGGSAVSANGANGANYGAYVDPVFDAELDSALAAPTLAAARPRFARAYQRIVDDAPAVWLWEPKTVLGLQQRVRPARIRPDAWWAHLADWTVAGPR